MFFLVVLAACSDGGPIEASENRDQLVRSEGEVEARIVRDGRRYDLIDGDVYEVKANGERAFVKQVYDRDFYQKNYEKSGGIIYRVDRGAGVRYPVKTKFVENFEGTDTLRDLVGPVRGWTGMTLLEPRAPTVRDFTRLRQRILDGKSGFLDNRVEPSPKVVRSGNRALALYAVPPSRGMLVSKASLDTAVIHFVKGDDFWFEGWFYLQRGTPLGLFDIECSFIDEGPGMRILLTKQGEPRVELKWADKPTYRAKPGVRLPSGRWVRVTYHLYLSERDDGRVELWFDDEKIIDGHGQTLPIARAVYDRMQVGITANPSGSTTVMYVDDLKIGTVRP